MALGDNRPLGHQTNGFFLHWIIVSIQGFEPLAMKQDYSAKQIAISANRKALKGDNSRIKCDDSSESALTSRDHAAGHLEMVSAIHRAGSGPSGVCRSLSGEAIIPRRVTGVSPRCGPRRPHVLWRPCCPPRHPSAPYFTSMTPSPAATVIVLTAEPSLAGSWVPTKRR